MKKLGAELPTPDLCLLVGCRSSPSRHGIYHINREACADVVLSVFHGHGPWAGELHGLQGWATSINVGTVSSMCLQEMHLRHATYLVGVPRIPDAYLAGVP
jgi:hypothetical protein